MIRRLRSAICCMLIGSIHRFRSLDWVRLVDSIAAGDQQALRALYERTHRIVFTLVMRICGNREMAEELTLDVFHDVWRRSGQYDPKGGSVVGWIMMQARSRAIRPPAVRAAQEAHRSRSISGP